MRNSIVFYLNGERHEVHGDPAFLTVADYLRYLKGLTGTKIVCAEGDCGACTILRARPYLKNADFEAINSCIMMVAQLDGCHVVTVEALALKDKLSCSQKAMMNCHGSQCGFCTPGFVMALEWMLERHEDVDAKTVQNHLTGNLCRCTGYKAIIEAGVEAARLKKQESEPSLKDRFFSTASLKELKKLAQESVLISGRNKTFFAPADLKSLSTFRKKNPQSVILGAGTDLGVQINKGKRTWTQVVSLQLLPELYELKLKKNVLKVGSQVTLSHLRKAFGTHPFLKNILDLFASPQIKNAATLAGNVANASPIADTPPFLLALDTQVEVLSPGSKNTKMIALSEFYLDYRKTLLKAGDVITALYLNLPKTQETLSFYKTSQRKDLDISCVNAALWLQKDKSGLWKQARLAFGGIAATPVRLTQVEKILAGKSLESLDWDQVTSVLQSEIKPLSDLRGTSSYRRVLAQNILRKMIYENVAP